MDDNFVSKSRIEVSVYWYGRRFHSDPLFNSQHVAPNDTFKTSLGTDSALRVTYPSARTLNRTTTQSSFAFLAKDARQSVAAHSQRITLRNSRPASVSALRVIDHVPVSTDATIKVNVLSPNGLGPIGGVALPGNEPLDKDRPWTNVQKGVKARWANLDVGGEGAVEWVCDIQPNEEVELELSWEVSAPVGQTWTKV
jgi:hypothetical protein